jgi:hypothetical protein
MEFLFPDEVIQRKTLDGRGLVFSTPTPIIPTPSPTTSPSPSPRQQPTIEPIPTPNNIQQNFVPTAIIAGAIMGITIVALLAYGARRKGWK